jgi:hypothetical protein
LPDVVPTLSACLINVKNLLDEMTNGEIEIASSNDSKKPERYFGSKYKGLNESSLSLMDDVDKIRRGSKPEVSVVNALCSCIFLWELNSEIDKFCVTELQFQRPNSLIVGTRGYFRANISAAGYPSFPIPLRKKRTFSDLCYSQTFSAQRILTIMAIVRCIATNYNLSHNLSTLLEKFSVSLLEAAPVTYKRPSISTLIKFWQDIIRN